VDVGGCLHRDLLSGKPLTDTHSEPFFGRKIKAFFRRFAGFYAAFFGRDAKRRRHPDQAAREDFDHLPAPLARRQLEVHSWARQQRLLGAERSAGNKSPYPLYLQKSENCRIGHEEAIKECEGFCE